MKVSDSGMQALEKHHYRCQQIKRMKPYSDLLQKTELLTVERSFLPAFSVGSQPRASDQRRPSTVLVAVEDLFHGHEIRHRHRFGPLAVRRAVGKQIIVRNRPRSKLHPPSLPPTPTHRGLLTHTYTHTHDPSPPPPHFPARPWHARTHTRHRI